MIEIEANREIKEIKDEYLMGLALPEIITGVTGIILAVLVYFLMPLPPSLKGYICAAMVVMLMFGATYKINGITPFGYLLKLIRLCRYGGRILVYKDIRIKEDKRNGIRETD